MGDVGLDGAAGALEDSSRPSPAATGHHKGDGWRSVLAGAAAGIVTAAGSWIPSLWSDESATVSAAHRPLSELWRMVMQIDFVHAVYYLFMHFWVSLFGMNQFILRVPSACAVAASGALLYMIAVRLQGRSFAALVSIVFAITPRVYWAGAEARPYAFTILLATAASFVLLTVLHKESAGAGHPQLNVIVGWITYSALLIAGILCNLYLTLLAVVHLTSILLDRTLPSIQRRRWAVAAGVAVATAIPFALYALRQSAQLGSRTFGIKELLQNVVVNQWFLGETSTTTTGLAKTTITARNIISWWGPAAVAFAAASWLLIAVGIYTAFKLRRSGNPRQVRTVVWSLPWIVVPSAVIGLYSVIVTPSYSARYLSFASPATSLLIALGLVSITSKWLRLATVVMLVIATIPVYLSQRTEYAKNSSDWSAVAAYVEDNARRGDGVYFAPRYDVDSSEVGRTTRGIATAYPQAFDGLVDITLRESPSDAGNLTGVSRLLKNSDKELAGLNAVWVIRRIDYPTDNALADDSFLRSVGLKATTQWEGPLDVVVKYERNR